MGNGFKDITLYCTTQFKAGTPEYIKEISLQNYISDLYLVCLHGYKPPNVTRISIEAETPKKWDKTWKHGSLILAPALFNYQKYASLNTKEQYSYILDMLHDTMIKLCDEYKWDNSVFEKAYKEVIEREYALKIVYPEKRSKDRKKSANISVEKSESITWVNAVIRVDGNDVIINLLEKKNAWWYDYAYILAKESKWLSNDRFGFTFKPGNVSLYYSLSERKTYFEVDGVESNQVEVEKILHPYFLL